MAKTVLVFGTFDPLHAGHEHFFKQAKALGDQLVVVVTRDSVIRQQKKREPFQPEEKRLHAVAHTPPVTTAILGDAAPETYETLRTQDFDILALGYDQLPADLPVRQLLRRLGKQQVAVVRLKPHQPTQYKSSLLRPETA